MTGHWNRTWKATFGLLAIILLCLFFSGRGARAAERSPAPVKIVASYGGELGYQAPLWVADNLKLFAKYGIDSEIIRIAGGARSMATLMSNATQVSQSSAVGAIQADLSGAELVAIATSTNRPAMSVIARPSIKDPKDIIGKKVGLVGRGDMNEFVFLQALHEWHIDPKSVTLIAMPGSQIRLAAIEQGAIDVTVLAPPFTFEGEKFHLRTLADFGTGTSAFPQSSLIVRKDFLAQNRGVLKRYLMAYSEAIHVIKSDPAKVLPIMEKYMRTKDEVIARRSYDYYSKLFSLPPYTQEKGIAFVLDFLRNKTHGRERQRLKAENFIDNNLLQELSREGFFSRLGK